MTNEGHRVDVNQKSNFALKSLTSSPIIEILMNLMRLF